jgi:diguanylate cyclase (GGDEF)-like protein
MSNRVLEPEEEIIIVLKEKIMQLEEQLRKYKYDSLTGVLMRRDFEVSLYEYFRSRAEFRLVLVDVDGLHSINRNEGYRAGDMHIRMVARELVDKNIGVVFRIGGDEFAVLSTKAINDVKVEGATTAVVCSKDFENADEMFNAADELVIAKKAELYSLAEIDRRKIK